MSDVAGPAVNIGRIDLAAAEIQRQVDVQTQGNPNQETGGRREGDVAPQTFSEFSTNGERLSMLQSTRQEDIYFSRNNRPASSKMQIAKQMLGGSTWNGGGTAIYNTLALGGNFLRFVTNFVILVLCALPSLCSKTARKQAWDSLEKMGASAIFMGTNIKNIAYNVIRAVPVVGYPASLLIDKCAEKFYNIPFVSKAMDAIIDFGNAQGKSRVTRTEVELEAARTGRSGEQSGDTDPTAAAAAVPATAAFNGNIVYPSLGGESDQPFFVPLDDDVEVTEFKPDGGTQESDKQQYVQAPAPPAPSVEAVPSAPVSAPAAPVASPAPTPAPASATVTAEVTPPPPPPPAPVPVPVPVPAPAPVTVRHRVVPKKTISPTPPPQSQPQPSLQPQQQQANRVLLDGSATKMAAEQL